LGPTENFEETTFLRRKGKKSIDLLENDQRGKGPVEKYQNNRVRFAEVNGQRSDTSQTCKYKRYSKVLEKELQQRGLRKAARFRQAVGCLLELSFPIEREAGKKKKRFFHLEAAD